MEIVREPTIITILEILAIHQADHTQPQLALITQQYTGLHIHHQVDQSEDHL